VGATRRPGSWPADRRREVAGFNAINAHKLLLTVVLLGALYLLSKLLRAIARAIGGARQRTAFWTRQGVSLAFAAKARLLTDARRCRGHLGRAGLGFFLIVAFSFGLAAVLIGLGMMMVYARRFMMHLQIDGPLTRRWLPVASSTFITVLGLVIAVQALAATHIDLQDFSKEKLDLSSS
jgi:hypothetical protein